MFFSSIKKKEKLVMVKYQTVTDEDYLTSEKIWDKFEMKYMDDYHNNYFKKMYYN